MSNLKLNSVSSNSKRTTLSSGEGASSYSTPSGSILMQLILRFSSQRRDVERSIRCCYFKSTSLLSHLPRSECLLLLEHGIGLLRAPVGNVWKDDRTRFGRIRRGIEE